ncbi:MAG TPA: PaaI family thioesterase [Trebonia sp.]|nr:PaaI family thioesterase [Trebonia sp.]
MNTEAVTARPGTAVAGGGPERSLGITRSKIVGDDVVASMASGPWLNGPAGSPPGGVLGVLIDDVLGFAIARHRGPGQWSVSAEISLDLTGPVPADGSRIEARARHVHSGPHGGISSGTVHDASGTLIALCRQHGRWVTTVPRDPMTPPEPGTEAAASAAAQAPAAAGTSAPWRPPASLAALLRARVQPTEGGAALDLEVTPDLTNPLGNLHGGITFAACDLAAQAALRAAGGPTQTASIHVTYPRPMPLGAAPRFEARVLHRGRSLGIVRVTATVDGVKPCSIATITTGVAG